MRRCGICAAATSCRGSSIRTSIFRRCASLGGLGYSLLDWLEQLTLPEEAGLATRIMRPPGERVHAASGGAWHHHGSGVRLAFCGARRRALFEAAERSGLRVFSGLVMSDRLLLPELHQTPERRIDDSQALIRRFHGQVGLRLCGDATVCAFRVRRRCWRFAGR